MRQSGIIAAGALHALRHHRERIAQDHANAKHFAELVARAPGVRLDLASVETNIVNVDLDAPLAASSVAAQARELGLAINPTAPRRLRAVLHLDIASADVAPAADILTRAIASARA